MSDWLTPQQVAEMLQVSCETVRRRCASGEFSRVVNTGTQKKRKYRIHRDCIESSLAEQPATPVRPKAESNLRGFELFERFRPYKWATDAS